MEFAEHREYVPGDDLRHLDWKVYGKTDRHYIKRYEEETSLTCHIVVDGSESMNYAGDHGVSKFDYAATAAASLAYLVLRQQDFVGLSVFDEKIRSFLNPSNNPAHLKALVHDLGEAESLPKTDVGMVLSEVATRVRQRGMVVLISDLFDEPEKILKGLKKLETLYVYGTHVSDAGLVHLEGLPALEELSVLNTKVTREGIKRFQEAHPDVRCDDAVLLPKRKAGS